MAAITNGHFTVTMHDRVCHMAPLAFYTHTRVTPCVANVLGQVRGKRGYSNHCGVRAHQCVRSLGYLQSRYGIAISVTALEVADSCCRPVVAIS